MQVAELTTRQDFDADDVLEAFFEAGERKGAAAEALGTTVRSRRFVDPFQELVRDGFIEMVNQGPRYRLTKKGCRRVREVQDAEQ